MDQANSRRAGRRPEAMKSPRPAAGVGGSRASTGSNQSGIAGSSVRGADSSWRARGLEDEARWHRATATNNASLGLSVQLFGTFLRSNGYQLGWANAARAHGASVSCGLHARPRRGMPNARRRAAGRPRHTPGMGRHAPACTRHGSACSRHAPACTRHGTACSRHAPGLGRQCAAAVYGAGLMPGCAR